MDDNDKMCEFIEAYKSLPELWNSNLDSYKDKSVRRRSYDKLLIKFRNVNSRASLEDLKKKIANMRTCYRRELKKRKICSDSGEEYVSTLWYFDLFEFLHDFAIPVSRRSNLSSDDNEELPSPKLPKKMKKSSSDNDEVEFLRKATQYLESSSNAEQKDDASIYGSAWACMFRQMTKEQQLYAKQAVDEIMLLGRMDKLTINYLNNLNSSSNISTPLKGFCSPQVVSLPKSTLIQYISEFPKKKEK